MLDGGDEGAAFDYFAASELSVFVEDGGIAELEHVADFFKIFVDFAFFFAETVLSEDLIHFA